MTMRRPSVSSSTKLDSFSFFSTLIRNLSFYLHHSFNLAMAQMTVTKQQQEVLSLWQNNNDEKTDFNQQRMRSGWDLTNTQSADEHYEDYDEEEKMDQPQADAKKPINALPKPNTAGVGKRSRNHQRQFQKQLTAAIHEEELIMDEICDEMKIEQDEAVMQDIQNYPMDQSEYPCML